MTCAASRTVLAIFGLAILVSFKVDAEIILTKVDRTIDITSQVAKIHSKITLENKGNAAVKDFLLAFEDDEYAHLSFLEVSDKRDGDDSKLTYAPATVAGQSGKFLKVSLPSALATDQAATYDVETTFSHILEPYPQKIGQSEKQLVLYNGNTVYYSPYEVKEQTTVVKLSSSTIESYSRLKPSSSSENTVTYGPYKDSKPYRTHQMRVHFENNSPFLTVNEMTRWIELSHWGNIAVEETYHMTHQGAELKGHFSRYDYQRTPTHAAIKSFKTVLPSAARDVYYRDEIGNISTSNMLVQDDSVEIELRPRFPLFGGWQTRYYMGYNVPAYQYLYNKGDNYILKMRLVDHVFDDFVIDKLTVKIILPESATNIQVKAPFAVTEGKREVLKTYLDTVGRPVVVIHKDNVVENHIQDLELHYTFQKIRMLQEPLLCVAAFYILFVSVIVLVRLDFSITKDAAKESRMKVASLVEDLLSACDRRSALYATFDAAIDKFKQGRDQAVLSNTLKKINQDYSTLSQSIGDICTTLIKEDPEGGDKLSELQKKEHDRKVLNDQLITLATKVVTGKVGRQQYIENEQTAVGKREKIAEDIDNLLATL